MLFFTGEMSVRKRRRHHPETPAWTVANFQTQPLQEDDWWLVVPTTSPEDDDSNNDHNNNSPVSCHYIPRSPSDLSSIEVVSSRSPCGNTNNSKIPHRHFQNRGLELWTSTRAVWRQRPKPTATNNNNHNNNSPNRNRNTTADPLLIFGLSHKDRQSIRPVLEGRRPQTLPQPLPLTEIIAAYQSIWHGSDDEDGESE